MSFGPRLQTTAILALTLAPLCLAARWLVRRLTRGEGLAGKSWPLILIICPLMSGSIWACTAGFPAIAQSIALGWALMVLALVDLEVFRLPDVLTLPLAALGLVLAVLGPPGALVDRGVGAALGYGSLWALSRGYRLVRGREGLGLGDAKLLAAAGAWLGWEALPAVVLIGCACGFLVVGLEMLRTRRWVPDRRLAFGAPLALATWIVWLTQSAAAAASQAALRM